MAWKGIHFVPEDTRISFIGYRHLCVTLSVVAIIGSLALFFTKGLNYGIDFSGGILVEVQTKDGSAANVEALRPKLNALGLGEVQIQPFGKPSDILIRLESQKNGDPKAQQEAVQKVKTAIGDGFIERRTEIVGPTVSGELKRDGLIAVALSMIAIAIYVWFRFEWQFSVGALASVFHDVILTVGIFSLLQWEFDLTIVAALLTLVGYSINDTIVVFDRIRENLRKYKKMEINELMDLSVNETLSRTTLTSLTTLLALLGLYFFGGEVIRGFTFAMIWGIFIGTYSSIFVASPLIMALGIKRDWSGLGTGKVKERASARP